MKREIDKASPVPYYHQLREIIQAQIEEGALAPGVQLPSEPELCEMYGVSRTVVRQALSELGNDAVVSRRKGKGTFVGAHKRNDHLAETLTGLHEDIVASGERLDDSVLRLERIAAPAHVARLLQVDDGSMVVVLERLRSVGGGPYVLTHSFMPLPQCEAVLGFDMRQRSLYDVIQHDLKLEIDNAWRTIEATVATTSLARQLDVPSGSPLLVLKSVAYLADGRPIEYFIAWHRGDRSRFEVHLHRPSATPPYPVTQRILFADEDGDGGLLERVKRSTKRVAGERHADL